MSKSEVYGPVSSAPSDRLALGAGWVRPGVAGIGGTQNPSFAHYTTDEGDYRCFEGSEE
jgi:hypothetical protein